MLKRYLSILLLFSILLYGMPTLSAQDIKCDKDTLHTTVNTFIGILKTLLDKDDPKEIAAALQDISGTAAKASAACNGLAFTGNKQKVIGPVEIPAGLYRLTLETKSESYIGIEASVADGECGGGAGGYDTLLFNTGGGIFPDTGEIIFKSSGCTVFIQVNIEIGEWSLDFENLSTGK